MKPRNLPLALTVLLSSCALFHRPAPQPPEDPSIRFPSFNERFTTLSGGEDQPFELDGMTLRALSLAANDFLPPERNSDSCVQRQDAHRYRVLRQGDIIFVEIFPDPTRCKHTLLDGSVKYAISTDGRILRRLYDGEPETSTPAAPASEESSTLVAPSQLGSTSAPPAADLPSSWFDGGVPDAGTAPDASVQPPDGG